ncbi:MAG: hypothetical protein JW818_21035 [Pirellulales bacterium]|nr:hypothetical protein [Pirellulales bacterium]
MKTRLLVAGWLIGLTSVIAAAAEGPAAPKYAEPEQAMVAREEGRYVLRTVRQDGTVVEYSVAPEGVQFHTADGRKMTEAQINQQLNNKKSPNKWVPVLVVKLEAAMSRQEEGDPAAAKVNLDDVKSFLTEWKSDASCRACFQSNAILALVAPQAPSEPRPLEKKEPLPPSCYRASLSDDGLTLHLVHWAFKPVWETRIRTITDATTGKTISRTYKVKILVREKLAKQAADGSYEVRDRKGRPIDNDEAMTLLVKPRPVVVSQTDGPLAGRYQAQLHKDAPVIVITGK